MQLNVLNDLAKAKRRWTEKNRRIVMFLTLSSSKVEEVSQTCCVFDVLSSKMEASQNSFVFKLPDR